MRQSIVEWNAFVVDGASVSPPGISARCVPTFANFFGRLRCLHE
jgi:hypothetical protein